MGTAAIWLAISTTIVVAAGCNYRHEKAAPPGTGPSGPEGSAYARLEAELFHPSCASCHNPGRSSGGIDLTSFGGVTQGGTAARAADAVAAGRMPPGGGVDAALVAALQCWVAKGAPQAGAADCFPLTGEPPQGPQPPAPPTPTQPPVGGQAAFAWLQAEVFNKSCASCHNTGRAAGGVNLTRLETITAAGVPARIVGELRAGTMPPRGALGAQLVDAVACWVEKGAPQVGASECVPGTTPGPQVPPPLPPPPPPGDDDDDHDDDDDDDGRDDDDDDDGRDDDDDDGDPDPPPPPPPPPPPTGPVFTEIQNLLGETGCYDCHAGPTNGDVVNLTGYDSVMTAKASLGDRAPVPAAPLVVPGSPETSVLYLAVEKGDWMPLDYPALTPEQLALLSRWIKEGARRE